MKRCILSSICFLALAGLTVFPALSYAYIVLEEVEVELVSEDGSRQKYRLSEEKARTIVDGVKADVLKELGLESAKDIKGEGALSGFNKMMEKRLSLQPLSPPRLRFYGSTGKILSEMLMKRPGSIGAYVMGGNTPLAVGQSLSRDAVVSEDGMYAAVTEYFAGSKSSDGRKGENETFSSISFYDDKGKVIWHYSSPVNTYVNRMAISGKGEVLAFLLVHEKEKNLKSAQIMSPNRLIVYDRNRGKEHTYPGEIAAYSVRSSFLKLSPSGNFGSIAVEKTPGEIETLLIDLRSTETRSAGLNCIPSNIEDNGSMVGSPPAEYKEINLNFSDMAPL